MTGEMAIVTINVTVTVTMIGTPEMIATAEKGIATTVGTHEIVGIVIQGKMVTATQETMENVIPEMEIATPVMGSATHVMVTDIVIDKREQTVFVTGDGLWMQTTLADSAINSPCAVTTD